jgi:transcriptional regulator with XRE-family HTH domain
MDEASQRARALKANDICRQRGLTQSQIADALGASQAQVSRILSGKGLRKSRLLEDVCLYLERLETGVTAESVRNNVELVEALRATWNGSAGHAKALAAVIRSLSVLGPALQAPGNKMEAKV